MARRRHARLVAGVAVVLAAVLLVVAPMGGMANVTPPPGDDVASTNPFRWIATSDGRDEGNELMDLASSSEHVAYATGYFVHSMSFPSVDGGPNCTALAHAPGDHDDGSPSVFVVAIQPLDGLCLGMFSPDHTSGSGESYGTAVSAGEGHVIVTGTYNGTLAFDATHVCRSDVAAPFTLAINFDLTIKGLHCGTFPAAGSRDFGYGKGAAPLPDGSHVIGGDFHGDLKVSDDVPVIKADFNNDGTNMFFVSKVPEKDDTSAWAVVGTMCDEVENTMAANNECGTASIHDMDVEGGADSGGDIVAVGLAADKPLFFIKEYVVENGAFVNRDKGNAVKYFSALGGNPFFLMRIAPDGVVKWVKQSVESDDLTDGRWRGRPRVAVDQSGDIFVCAPAFSEVKLDSPGDTLFVGLLYKYTNVVIKYNATGSLLWALSIDAGPTNGCALTMHTEERILVVGSADRNVTVGYAWPQSQPTPTERIPFDSDVPLGAKSVGYAAEFDTRTGKYLGHVYISSKKSNGLTLRGAASIPFDPNDAKGNVYIGGHFHGQTSFASQDVDKTGAVFLSRMQLDEETYVRNLSPPLLDDSHPFLNSMSAVVLTFTFLVFGVLFYYCYWRKRLKKRSGGWRRVANIELDDMDDIGA